MDDPQTVTVAVTPVTLPTDFGLPQAAALARDLAIQMYDRPAILRKHKITEEQCAYLETQEAFAKMLAQAVKEWNAPGTMKERLAIEAGVGLELAMPDLIARMKSRNEPLPGVVQAAKLLADVAGAVGQQQQAQVGERFTISINLGADKQTFEKTIEVQAVQPIAQGAGSLLPLPAITEGAGAGQAVQPLTEGAGPELQVQPHPEKGDSGSSV